MVELSAGILLIAEPFLKDPNFMRTVVLLCDHQEEGSFGFVLNKQYNHTLDELIPELMGMKIPVFAGGPVQPDTLHFLHTYPELLPGSHEITDGVYWGGDFEMVKHLLIKDELDLKRIRFFVGYSGWGTNQLEEEMNSKSWLTAKAKKNIILHRAIGEIWKDSLRLLGDEYAMMINFPTDPQLN
ncbi:MAG: YqgE/AlgH family protein [Chitinophagaceae bacterium]|nr:YqgE/AlgH family protein [Chitinophagaceae bacterium]